MSVLLYWFVYSAWCWEYRVQEPCESRGGRPGLSILMSLTVSVDVKQHWTMLMHWSQFVPNMSTQHPRTLSSTSSSPGWNHVFVWLVNHDGYSRAILGPGKVSLEPDPSPKFHCRFSDLRGNLRVERASQTCSTVPSTQILTTRNTAIYLEQQIWYDSPCNRLIFFLNSFCFTFSLFLPHSMESQLWSFYLKLTIFAEKVLYPPSLSCFSTYSDNPRITVLQ